MEIQQPQRKRDIDEAQSRVVAVVRKLEEAGTIVIAGDERGGERSGCLRAPSATTSSSSSPPSPRRAMTPARMLAQASAEAERIRELARAEGFAGRSCGGARAGCSRDPRRGVGPRRGPARHRVAARGGGRGSRADAIELALALAGKILAGALQARPELVVEVVQGALRRISDRRRITVLVNPADLDTVRAAIGEITAQGSGVELCDLQSDERVGVGGAIVRTAEGEVDASVADPARARARGGQPLARKRRAGRMSEAGAPGAPGALLASGSEAIREADLARRHGFVSNLIGLIIEATGLQAEVGEVCLVGTDRNRAAVSAEVVGFREGRTLLMPLGELHGIGPGTRVLATGAPFRIAVGDGLLGGSSTGSASPTTGSPCRVRLRAPPSARPRAPSRGPASASASASACARWTASCPAAAASGSGSSPARASASPRCWG